MAGSKRKARPALAVHQAPAAAEEMGPDTEHPGRVGKVMLGIYIPRVAHKQFKRLCCDLDRTQQEVITEALNEIFRRHGLPPIA